MVSYEQYLLWKDEIYRSLKYYGEFLSYSTSHKILYNNYVLEPYMKELLYDRILVPEDIFPDILFCLKNELYHKGTTILKGNRIRLIRKGNNILYIIHSNSVSLESLEEVLK